MASILLTQLPRIPYRGPGQEPEATRICASLQFTSHGMPGVRLADALNNAPTGLDDLLMGSAAEECDGVQGSNEEHVVLPMEEGTPGMSVDVGG